VKPGDFRQKWAQTNFEIEADSAVWNWRGRNALRLRQKDGNRVGVVVFPLWAVLVVEEREIAAVRVLKTDSVRWTWGWNEPPFGTVRVAGEEAW